MKRRSKVSGQRAKAQGRKSATLKRRTVQTEPSSPIFSAAGELGEARRRFARDNFFLALKTHANSKIIEPLDHGLSPSWYARGGVWLGRGNRSRNRCWPISAVPAASVPAGHADLSDFNARDSAVCVWNRYLFGCGSTSWSNRVG